MKNYKSSEEIAVLIVLTNSIKRKELNVQNAMMLTLNVIEVIRNSKLKFNDNKIMEVTTEFIREIAKGKDGQLGTMDDLIPANILKEIEELLASSVLSDIMAICIDLIKLKKINTKRSLFCLSKVGLKL